MYPVSHWTSAIQDLCTVVDELAEAYREQALEVIELSPSSGGVKLVEKEDVEERIRRWKLIRDEAIAELERE